MLKTIWVRVVCPTPCCTNYAKPTPCICMAVSLNIGTMGDLDMNHLQRLKRVVEMYDPALVSEHLAWSSHDEARTPPISVLICCPSPIPMIM